MSSVPREPHGESESILDLLEHFKDDDGRVAILVKELQELSLRVQAADTAVVDPRLTTRKAASAREEAGSERLRGIDAFAAAVRRVRHQLPASRQPSVVPAAGEAEGGAGGGAAGGSGGGSASGGAAGPGRLGGGTNTRVEEAFLPAPPDDTSQALPLPHGGHEWEALQAAVNDSVAAFGAAAAKMGWKKWALTRAHSALLVSLFWWVVAAAFRPDHALSRPLQDFAFGHFCRHYVTVVLRLRGKARDQYQQVWIEMMAAAALYLLAEVYPRSQHKFDDGLRVLITKQLRLWTAGALPADLHPSAHADAHDAAPAAFAVASSAAAAAATQQKVLPNGRSGASVASAAAPSLSLPSFSGASFGGPSQSARGTTAGTLRLSVNTSRRSHGGGAAGGGGGGGPLDGGGHGGPQAYVVTKNSPAMVQMLLGAGGGGGGGGGEADGGCVPPVVKGLLKNTVGGTLARLHRALDEASDEELSYNTLAAAATASASDAVQSYEARKRAAAADTAAMRRGLVEAKGAIEARQRAALACGASAVKQMSDRLSGYIQNDVDRLLSGQPASMERWGEGAEAPRYLRPTAAHGGDPGGVIKPARLMAPLSEMRRVEGNIRAALAGGRHSSTDTAARAAAVTAAREAANAADWRPLAQYPVGTKDTRRRKMAATILHGLDLEPYSV